MYFVVFICSAVLLNGVISSPLQKITARAAAKEDYRLPTTINPENYRLQLFLEDDIFTTNTYTGVLVLTFRPVRVTGEIKLHANNLTIANYQIRSSSGAAISIVNSTEDSETDIWTITTGEDLFTDSSYTLTVSYTAYLTVDEMYGFYKSSYLDENDRTVFLATTQFQPTYARRVLPCFDEPSFKATFDITLKYPDGYSAVGNTRIKSSEVLRGITTTVFETTPKMSSYLVAFIVSDFTCTSGVDVEPNYPYRVCSRDEERSTRKLAVDLGPKLLWSLENFTQVKYSESEIGKMDQMAIPDFAAGAMENWGLVTYRERYLLWDHEQSSNRYKQNVATIVAHEFSHMWFGNLITTHWWSDTFLNEGFATYFEYFTTHSILPSWELDKQFVLEQVHSVLDSDSSITIDPLSSAVYTPQEISGRFTSISYNKGGAVLRMVESFMGTEAFKAGITHYLTTYKLSNTRPTDLWNALNTHATGLPTNMLRLMDNWTNRGGYPLISVTANGTDVIISQSRFLRNGTDITQWHVPISYTTSNEANKFVNTLPKNWLNPGFGLILRGALEGSDWIVLNNQQTGYYRVDYDDALWDKISAALAKENFDGILDINRAEIVDDLFSLARVNKRTYARVFQITSFLSKDVSYYPWYAALNAFSVLLQRVGNQRLKTYLNNYVVSLMENLYASVPFTVINDDDQIYTLKKVLAITWACRLGHSGCTNNATTAFRSYKDYGGRPNANLRAVVYCNGLRYSTNVKEDWEFLWQQYNQTKIATEKITLISALGCASDVDVVNSYLTKSITEDSGIRRQDASSVFSAVYTNNLDGVDIALDFLINNYREIHAYYASMNSLLSLINGLSSRIASQEQLKKLSDFVEEADLDDSIRESARRALGTAETNLVWTESIEKQLTEYFRFDTGAASSIKVGAFTVINLAALIYYLAY